ncbi:MAG: glycyl-radical enzyme activating protein [Bacteroidales bacterium]|nr:glycyl-radical enzyme activating protein [Bacteroidales bacterium]
MGKIRVFNIQHYCVHDGPGIRTTVFLKGCPLACQWCCNPESQSFELQLRHSSIRCKNCLQCVQSCDKNAVKNVNGKPEFNFSVCANCHTKACMDTCYYDALSLSGKDYNAEELFSIIEKDKEFYSNSGGGVTFSGGEPLAQAVNLTELLKLCKSSNIHTAVETCGFVSQKQLSDAAKYIDLFLFDIKIIDNRQHIHYTGQNNELILNNLDLLSKMGCKIVARIPLIPQATDNQNNIDQIISLCRKFNIRDANLEIYHRLGIQKYNDYGIPFILKENNLERDNDFYFQICALFNKQGIKCEIL